MVLRVHKTFSIDVKIAELLENEVNASNLINSLLTEYYENKELINKDKLEKEEQNDLKHQVELQRLKTKDETENKLIEELDQHGFDNKEKILSNPRPDFSSDGDKEPMIKVWVEALKDIKTIKDYEKFGLRHLVKYWILKNNIQSD
jgi:hypothetical protein